MAGNVNKVILIGRCGQAPDIRTGRDGSKTAQISLATGESWRDKTSGERRERTTWHRVVIFDPAMADLAEKYLRKGSLVMVEGQLDNRKWTDRDNIERTITEVVIRQWRGSLVLLDKAERAPDPDEGAYGGHSDAPPPDDIPL